MRALALRLHGAKVAAKPRVDRYRYFDNPAGLTTGSRSLVAPGCFITDHNHAIVARVRIVDQGISTSPVAIGEDVWIGADVSILPGVRIGYGAVIGAGSVVARDVPAFCIAIGSPARFIRERD